MGRVYQTSLWVEQVGEMGGTRRRDSAPGGSKCSFNKSTTSRKPKNTEGTCHEAGAFCNTPMWSFGTLNIKVTVEHVQLHCHILYYLQAQEQKHQLK